MTRRIGTRVTAFWALSSLLLSTAHAQIRVIKGSAAYGCDCSRPENAGVVEGCPLPELPPNLGTRPAVLPPPPAEAVATATGLVKIMEGYEFGGYWVQKEGTLPNGQHTQWFEEPTGVPFTTESYTLVGTDNGKTFVHEEIFMTVSDQTLISEIDHYLHVDSTTVTTQATVTVVNDGTTKTRISNVVTGADETGDFTSAWLYTEYYDTAAPKTADTEQAVTETATPAQSVSPGPSVTLTSTASQLNTTKDRSKSHKSSVVVVPGLSNNTTEAKNTTYSTVPLTQPSFVNTTQVDTMQVDTTQVPSMKNLTSSTAAVQTQEYSSNIAQENSTLSTAVQNLTGNLTPSQRQSTSSTHQAPRVVIHQLYLGQHKIPAYTLTMTSTIAASPRSSSRDSELYEFYMDWQGQPFSTAVKSATAPAAPAAFSPSVDVVIVVHEVDAELDHSVASAWSTTMAAAMQETVFRNSNGEPLDTLMILEVGPNNLPVPLSENS